MFKVKVLENGQVELKFKFPLETVPRGYRIGSSSVLSEWVRVYLPDIILVLGVPQKLSYREVEKTVFSPIAFRFYYELEKYLDRVVGSIPTLCITKKDIPFRRVESECVVWFKASPHSPKHRTIATIFLTANIKLSQPIGVQQFYKFVKSFCAKVKKKVVDDTNKYLPLFFKDYEKSGKISFDIRFKDNLDFEIQRCDFVPTDDIRKLSPLRTLSYTLEFVSCDKRAVKSVISGVKRGKDLMEKISTMTLILSTLDYKVVSSPEPIVWSSGVDPQRPETLLMKLSKWLKSKEG